MVVDFTFFLLTWNVMDTAPSDEYNSLLSGITSQNNHDFIIIGLQEVKFPNLFAEPWIDSTKQALKGSNYVVVKKIQLVGILLIILSKRDILPQIKNVITTYVKTGLAGYWGNKGAVSVRFDINGHPIVIVNSHLSAHDYNLFKRIKEYANISHNLTFDLRKPPRQYVLNDHKTIIWLGDLNFRLEDISVEEISDNLNILRAQPENLKVIEYLMQFDQLGRTKRDSRAFEGYNEHSITFPPSYKFFPNTDEYDQNRKPSWCDRILYKVLDGTTTQVSSKNYKLHSDLKQSDHRPVSQELKLTITGSHHRNQRAIKFARPRSWRAKQDSLAYFSFNPILNAIDGQTNASEASGFESEMPSAFDWVGLYHEDFTDVEEPLTYVWVDTEKLSELQSRSISLLESCPESNVVPSTSSSREFNNSSSRCSTPWYRIKFLDLLIQEPGHYRLLYFNENNDVLGMSERFEIKP